MALRPPRAAGGIRPRLVGSPRGLRHSSRTRGGTFLSSSLAKEGSTRVARQAKTRSAGTNADLPATEPALNGPVFWLLVAMSMGTLAACVIVPEWRHLQLLTQAKQQHQQRVDLLQGHIDHQKRLLKALRTDPALVQRLAQRDLSLNTGQDKTVWVSTASAPTTRGTDPASAGIARQQSATAAPPSNFLADYDFAALFCDEQARLMLLVLSTTLLAVAIYLSGRQLEVPQFGTDGA